MASQMITKPCDTCGAAVTRRAYEFNGKSVYCSRECFGAGHSKIMGGENNPNWQKVALSCGRCGQPVMKSPSRLLTSEKVYCSKSCRSADMSERFSGEANPFWGGGKVECPCAACGKMVHRAPSAVRGAVYCSKKCQDSVGRVIVPCDWCGAEKEMTKWEQGRTPNHFCNRECFAAWQKSDKNPQNKQIRVTCTMCDQEFMRSPSGYREGKPNFCSKTCADVHQKQLRGLNHWNWRGGGKIYYGDNWSEQRRAAVRRDNYRCQRCRRFRGQEGAKLDVHHIKPFKSFGYIPGVNENYKEANDLSNLVTLCKSCHTTVEPRGKRSKT